MSSRTEFASDNTDKLLKAAARRARLAPLLSWLAVAMAVSLFLLFAYQSGMFSGLLPKPLQKPLEVAAPEQITGQNARIAGFDRQQQPYEILAQKGLQDKTNANLVHLEEVSGTFKKISGETFQLLSNTGLYDSKSKGLDLDGAVKIIRPDHFTATMDKAHVNVETKDLESNVPVAVEMSNGSIKANGMRIRDNGKTVVFVNGVKARFNDTANKGDEAQ
jgi:lipopolysaccharide export system protein LptC